MVLTEVIEEFRNIYTIRSCDETKCDIMLLDKEIDGKEYCSTACSVSRDDETLKMRIEDNIIDFHHIESCYQMYEQPDDTKEEVERLYKREKEEMEQYCNSINKLSKYWELEIDFTDIEDNCGWQFLEFPKYILKEGIKELIEQEMDNNKKPNIYIDFNTEVDVTIDRYTHIMAHSVKINRIEVYMDCYDEYGRLLGTVYYKKNNISVYVEDYDNDNTIDLINRGELSEDISKLKENDIYKVRMVK